MDYGNGSVISYTYDAAGNRLTYSGVVSSDTTPPTIAITSPTTGSAYTNNTATINLSGTASDNNGVTLVTWQNFSGGIGVATGTNSWSIASLPLKYGVNNIIVTAYDAAGNSGYASLTVTFAPGSGGTGTTTNTVFTESGSGSTIDPTKWTTSGNTVVESGGTMQVLTTVTDQGGNLTSVPIPINQHGDITITRSTFMHYGGQQYIAQMQLFFSGLPMAAIGYANYIWAGNPSYGWEDRYGFYISRDGAGFIDQSADTNLAGPFNPIWDTWFTEKLVYSPDTGNLQYFTNNVAVTNFNIGILPPTNNPTLQFNFNAWGWYTGHEQIFSNLVVSQVVPASVSAPLFQMSNTRLVNNVFRFTLNGLVNSNYVVQTSSNLVNWTDAGTNTIPSEGTIDFGFPINSNQPQMFYRAKPAP